MGPDASLNDILNYDFTKRFNKKKDPKWRLGEDGQLFSAQNET